MTSCALFDLVGFLALDAGHLLVDVLVDLGLLGVGECGGGLGDVLGQLGRLRAPQRRHQHDNTSAGECQHRILP